MSRRFLLRLSFFILPFALVFIIYLFFAWKIRIFMPLEMIVQFQQENEFALFDIDLDDAWRYKSLTIANREPSVLLLGSSRTLGFRDRLCTKIPETFYNAGLRAADYDDILDFGRLFIDSHSPQLILLSLDQNYFNQESVFQFPDIARTESELEFMLDNAYSFAHQTREFGRSRWWQLFQGLEPIYGNQGIQSNAILQGIGYRADGSYQFGKAEYEGDGGRLRTAFGVSSRVFATGNAVNTGVVEAVDEFLSYAESKNSQVIAYFPPFSPSSYEEHFSERETTHAYLGLANQMLHDVFTKHGFSFFDFTNPASLGITDEMMLDEWHLSERSSLILFSYLLNAKPELLNSCADSSALESALAASSHPYLIFPPYTSQN